MTVIADTLAYISGIPIVVNPNLPVEKRVLEQDPSFGMLHGNRIALEQSGMIIGWIELTAPRPQGGKACKIQASQEFRDLLHDHLKDRKKSIKHG